MYNRFLPVAPPPERRPNHSRSLFQSPLELVGKTPASGLAGLLNRFGLRDLDKGDLLLMLILLLLCSEDEDGWENLLVIALAFLMS